MFYLFLRSSMSGGGTERGVGDRGSEAGFAGIAESMMRGSNS